MIAPDWTDPNTNLGPWTGDYTPGPMQGHVEIYYPGDGTIFGGTANALPNDQMAIAVACFLMALALIWQQLRAPRKSAPAMDEGARMGHGHGPETL